MSNGFEQQPMGLRPPRVPFDLRCVTLAALGYLALLLGDWALAKVLSEPSPVAQALAWTGGLLGGVGRGVFGMPQPMDGWKVAVTGAVFFAIWGFFGGALMRACALRLTRDEPLSLRASLAFGARNWLTYLSAPIVVLLFSGFFALCNMAAGALISIWGFGSSLLVLLLFPLVLVSALLVTFSVLGGIVSMPLMWAGISVEQNGALEAVSRTFSYLFARPFRFIVGMGLLLVMMAVIVFVGDRFDRTVKQTLRAGIWRAELDDVVTREPESVTHLVNPYEKSSAVVRRKAGIGDIRNMRDARWYDKVGFFWMWLMLGIFMLGFKGYAIYVLLGGTVSLYLQLRRVVDGADEAEIYPPADDGDTGAAEPKWVAEPQPEQESEPESGPEKEEPAAEDESAADEPDPS
ncbi:MAG: hypothetical protein ACYTGN_00935 [Planctomycetota bacterium]|jgi:hypothetical protein